MHVSRAGYYRHLQKGISTRQTRSMEVAELVVSVHKEHPSHGYRWVAAYIRENHGIKVSDSFVYKIFRVGGLSSKTKHKPHRRAQKPARRYENMIYSTWECVDSPLQVIVSDMTVIKCRQRNYELTMYFDVFTKQMLSWDVSSRRGAREPYLSGLEQILTILEAAGGCKPTILHTDNGSVYASIAYNELIKGYNIIRSLSRPGKPTDNPVNESLNGWIKEEMVTDFSIQDSSDIVKSISEYVDYYNSRRPCYALGYRTPDKFLQAFIAGEIEHRNTFENRILSDVPKFVQKRIGAAIKEKQEAADKERRMNEIIYGVSIPEKNNSEETMKLSNFKNAISSF